MSCKYSLAMQCPASLQQSDLICSFHLSLNPLYDISPHHYLSICTNVSLDLDIQIQMFIVVNNDKSIQFVCGKFNNWSHGIYLSVSGSDCPKAMTTWCTWIMAVGERSGYHGNIWPLNNTVNICSTVRVLLHL